MIIFMPGKVKEIFGGKALTRIILLQGEIIMNSFEL